MLHQQHCFSFASIVFFFLLCAILFSDVCGMFLDLWMHAKRFALFIAFSLVLSVNRGKKFSSKIRIYIIARFAMMHFDNNFLSGMCSLHAHCVHSIQCCSMPLIMMTTTTTTTTPKINIKQTTTVERQTEEAATNETHGTAKKEALSDNRKAFIFES